MQCKLDELTARCTLGVQRVPIPRRPGGGDAAAMRSVFDVCRATAPDVVHGHGAKGAAYARLLSRKLGAKAVCTPHGGALHFSYASLNGAAYLLLERALKSRTDAMIFESAYAREIYERKLGRIDFPHRVILNGLYDEEFNPVDTVNNRYDFVFVGEFRELKGIFVLVDAAAALKARHRFSMLMVGSGPDELALRKKISDGDLVDAITVCGPMHPARVAFSQGRFLVAPSLHESMPYIVLEAVAAGVPLVTTAVGGIPEVMGPYADTLLAPGNVAALANRLASMLEDPADAIERAAFLRTRARSHLTVSEMTDSVCRFYEEIGAC
jgi:glycosyltransferase involved in cell wall biosynthesis